MGCFKKAIFVFQWIFNGFIKVLKLLSNQYTLAKSVVRFNTAEKHWANQVYWFWWHAKEFDDTGYIVGNSWNTHGISNGHQGQWRRCILHPSQSYDWTFQICWWNLPISKMAQVDSDLMGFQWDSNITYHHPNGLTWYSLNRWTIRRTIFPSQIILCWWRIPEHVDYDDLPSD